MINVLLISLFLLCCWGCTKDKSSYNDAQLIQLIKTAYSLADNNFILDGVDVSTTDKDITHPATDFKGSNLIIRKHTNQSLKILSPGIDGVIDTEDDRYIIVSLIEEPNGIILETR